MREAVERHPELIDYSRYACSCSRSSRPMGASTILPVFFPRLVAHSQSELERIGRFLDHEGPLVWDNALKPQNQGRERLRPSPIRQALVQAPVLSTTPPADRAPAGLESLKEFWRAQIEPPTLPPDLVARLREVFDADLAQLGSWLGIALDCETFHAATQSLATVSLLRDRS